MDSPQAEGESYPVEAVLSPGGEITGVQLSLTCGSTGLPHTGLPHTT